MYYSSLMWDGGRPIIGCYCVMLLSNVERLKGAKRASLEVLKAGKRVSARDGGKD